MRKHTISFQHAFDGIVWSIKTQPNYRFHFFFSVVAFILGVFLKISYFEFLILALLIVIGFVVETVNTSIEETCDAIDTAVRPDIKIAKDTAAGAMLLFAIGAVVIAGVIFLPRLFHLFF